MNLPAGKCGAARWSYIKKTVMKVMIKVTSTLY
jgi:hypothetical protein